MLIANIEVYSITFVTQLEMNAINNSYKFFECTDTLEYFYYVIFDIQSNICNFQISFEAL